MADDPKTVTTETSAPAAAAPEPAAKTTVPQPDAPTTPNTSAIDPKEIESLRATAKEFESWRPALAELGKRHTPDSLAALFKAPEPKPAPVQAVGSSASMEAMIDAKLAALAHNQTAATEAQAVKGLLSSTVTEADPEPIRVAMTLAIERKIELARAESFYPEGHPLRDKAFAPLPQAKIDEISKWAKDQMTGIRAGSMIRNAASARPSLKLASGPASGAELGKPNTKPGYGANRAQLEAATDEIMGRLGITG